MYDSSAAVRQISLSTTISRLESQKSVEALGKAFPALQLKCHEDLFITKSPSEHQIMATLQRAALSHACCLKVYQRTQNIIAFKWIKETLQTCKCIAPVRSGC